MNRYILALIYYGIPIALVVGLIAWEVASWRECLETQSWWYCFRILGN